MRIAMCSWEAIYAVPVGGVAVHVYKLAAALRKAGHEVHIFTRLGPNQSMHDSVFGVQYHRCPFDKHESFIEETANMCNSFVHYIAAEEEKSGNFDLIFCHDWLTVRAGLKIKTEKNTHFVMTFHTTEWGRSGKW
ncbi:MAG: glycosyltransferase, partial [Planctomycetes bacterium]|nr:glycosyltransferase [Planctomycetota bacterium]